MPESTVAENVGAHTPGPWTAEPIPPDAHTDVDIRIPEEYVFWIAESRVAGHVLAVVEHTSTGSAEANARLIAAAPDLLDALADLNESVEQYLAGPSVDRMNGLTAALRFARSVVAKAEGQS